MLMWLYRIQHPDHFGGAWYNEDGSSNRIVDTLTDKRLSEMPMEPDHSRYHVNGVQWQCAGWSLDHLKMWFTEADAEELLARGFKLAKFKCSSYFKQEFQINFDRNTITEIKYYNSYKEMHDDE